MILKPTFLVALMLVGVAPAVAGPAVPVDTEVATFAVNATQASLDYRGPRDRTAWNKRIAKFMTGRGVKGADQALQSSGNHHFVMSAEPTSPRMLADSTSDFIRIEDLDGYDGQHGPDATKVTVEAVSVDEWIVRTAMTVHAWHPGHRDQVLTSHYRFRSRVVRTRQGLRLDQLS